jgi:hypothetical protein
MITFVQTQNNEFFRTLKNGEKREISNKEDDRKPTGGFLLEQNKEN